MGGSVKTCLNQVKASFVLRVRKLGLWVPFRRVLELAMKVVIFSIKISNAAILLKLWMNC